MRYSDKLLKQGNFIINYSHHRRYSTIIDLLEGKQYKHALDWGCADGFILKALYDKQIIKKGTGVDISSKSVNICRSYYEQYQDLTFFTVDELAHSLQNETYDLLICTEVLEHVGDIEKVLSEMMQFANENSIVVVSSPIELGPSLLVKQFFRFLANFNTPYTCEKYSLFQLLKAAIFWDTEMPLNERKKKNGYLGHKDYDFRVLEKHIDTKFDILKKYYSPVNFFKKYINSTAWLVFKKSIT